MVLTIIFGALLTGGMGAVAAILLGAAWWVDVLAFIGAGNLGTGLILGFAFLRGNETVLNNRLSQGISVLSDRIHRRGGRARR